MLLTIQEVAERLRVNVGRAHALARDGVIPVVRLGRQVRVDEDRLQAFIGGGDKGFEGGWRKEPAVVNGSAGRKRKSG
ncbi:MAG: helix-turn-helix domain-containing protein [Candidatus Sericytochromatia bacterium]|nr:helix-turn-helix domain-containing protein [Candidatus Tanganyikabacteria bacterium]